MKKTLCFVLCTLALLSNRSFANPANEKAANSKVASKTPMKNSPLSFIENKGQVVDQNQSPRPDIQFRMGATNGLNIFVGNGAIHYQFSKTLTAGNVKENKQEMLSMYRMDVELVGANVNATAVASEPQRYYENHYTGKQSFTVHSYNKVTYKDIYPNIDWVLYVKDGKLEHEFVVRQGGNAGDIKLKYGGATDMQIGQDGNLTATTPEGIITEGTPYSYQADGAKVSSRFVLNNNVISYETGSYTGDLVIDPALAWSTYYGGSLGETSTGMIQDAIGNEYVTGYTNSSSGIATSGSWFATAPGGEDAFLAVFTSGGYLEWATYYGGPGYEQANGIATDNFGNIFIVGETGGSPGLATGGAYQTTFGGGIYDGFVAAFDGTGLLEWSTFLGAGGNDVCNAVCSDASGNVIVTGYTSSASGLTTSGANQTIYGGGTQDAFLALYNGGGVLQWLTYDGGSLGEIGNAVCTDAAGNINVSGSTMSTDLVTTSGAYQSGNAGGQDGFVGQFSSAGTLNWQTYFGGPSDDEVDGIAADAFGNVYFSGTTASGTGISTPGSYQASYGGGTTDGYVTRFSGLGAITWATYYGGGGNDNAAAVALDVTGNNVFITGGTSSATGIALSGGYQTTKSTASDAFVVEINTTTGVPSYASYYGGNANDFGTAVFADDSDNFYVYGYTSSTTGIATTGAYQPANAGSADAFLTKFKNCNLPVAGEITGATMVCPAGTTTLADTSTSGIWSATNTNASVIGGVVSGLSLGMDTIIFTTTNTCGTDTAMFVINVSNTPDAGTITGPNVVCTGDSVSLADATPGGVWSMTNANATIGTAGEMTGVTIGLDTVNYTVTLSCGSATAVLYVTVNGLPAPPAISGPSVICLGTPVHYTDALGGGFWFVYSTTYATINPTSGVATGLTAGADSIIYNAVNGCGSMATKLAVTVTALPVAGTITGPSSASVCEGSTITLSDTSPGGVWTPFNSDVSVSGPSITGSTAGTDTIYYSVTNACGTAIAKYAITVNPLPVAGTITGTSPICATTTTLLHDASPGGIWTSSVGSVATVGSTGIVTGVLTGITAGVSVISYSVTTVCGTAVATFPITINPQPLAGTISGATSLCRGTTKILTDAGAGGAGVWSTYNGLITQSSGVITAVTVGVDTIMYTYTNICGTAVAKHVDTVIDVPNTAPIGGLAGVCTGATITLSDGTPGGIWATSASGTASVSTGGVVTGITTGTTTIAYTVTNVCGSTTATKDITVSAVPVAGTVTGPDTLCPDVIIRLEDATPGGEWTITNGKAIIDETGVISGLTAGQDTAIYTITNACGSATISFPVTILPRGACDRTYVQPLASSDASLIVFPNPNQGNFTVKLNSGITGKAHFIITNVLGEKVQEFDHDTNDELQVTMNVPGGIYFIAAIAEGNRYTEKVTIR